MNLQYISDNKGQPTGIFIPIQDWQYLKKKYKGLDKEELVFDVPEWHKIMYHVRELVQKCSMYFGIPYLANHWIMT